MNYPTHDMIEELRDIVGHIKPIRSFLGTCEKLKLLSVVQSRATIMAYFNWVEKVGFEKAKKIEASGKMDAD